MRRGHHQPIGVDTAALEPPFVLRVPFRRDVLGFEFVPALDDARGISSSGHAFTKVGTPTLASHHNAYDFGTGDAITFDGAAINEMLNADPSGFTVFVVMPTPADEMGVPRGEFPHASILTLTNNDTDWPLSLYAQDDEDGAIALYAFIAYDDVNYEGTEDFGHPALMAPGQNVFVTRYDRTVPPAQTEEVDFDDPAPRGRLVTFFDGVEYPTDVTEQGDPDDPDAVAGTISTATGGLLYIGDDDAGNVIYPRIGGILIYTERLSDADVAQISSWLKSNWPVAIA